MLWSGGAIEYNFTVTKKLQVFALLSGEFIFKNTFSISGNKGAG